MKNLILLLFMNIALLPAISSQSFETDKEAQSQIQKLDFLIGDWKGQGWRTSPNGEKHHFEQTEKVQFKLDSTAVLIEGKGIAEGKVIHNALAVITSDKDSEAYSFQSFLQNGMKGTFKAEIIDGSLYWYPSENVRYIININQKGEWHEIGEFNRQENWMKFFEMTLIKV